MTADKVTLRLNALVTFRVVDPVRAVAATEAYDQALYWESQLRGTVGGGSLIRSWPRKSRSRPS